MQKKRPTKHQTPPRQLSSLWKQIGIGLVLLCFFGGLTYGVYKITRLDRFQVAGVVVSGGETISHEVITDTAEKELQGDYYSLVPKRFVYTAPEEKIAAVVEDIPRVNEVSVETRDNTIYVAVTEYDPFVLLCRQENCYLTAIDGTVFAPAPKLEGRSLARIEILKEINLLDKPISSEQLIWLVAVRDALLEKFSWSVKSLDILNETDIAIQFTASTLFVRNDQTPEELVSQIEQILASEDFAHLSPEDVEYVDMRYGNKIFVKEKEEDVSEDEVINVEAE